MDFFSISCVKPTKKENEQVVTFSNPSVFFSGHPVHISVCGLEALFTAGEEKVGNERGSNCKLAKYREIHKMEIVYRAWLKTATFRPNDFTTLFASCFVKLTFKISCVSRR